MVVADEDDVAGWVQDDPGARGYAPYVFNLEDAEAHPDSLVGVLRGDVVKRRKPHRFDAATPG